MGVPVGQVQIHTADSRNQNFRHKGRHPVTVAISRHLPELDSGEFFLQNLSVIIVVTQMNQTVGLDLADTQSHEGQCAVGVGKYQKFHNCHPFLSRFPIVYHTLRENST